MPYSHPLPSIDLELPQKLQDPAYREEFFLAEASAEIARQLIALRKRRGLSQAEVAALADTHQPAVSRAEQADYHNWSFNTLRKLSNALGGRLRVVIEPWEDVLSEYYPEGYTAEIDDRADEVEELLPSPPVEREKRMLAATAGQPGEGIRSLAFNAGTSLNRMRGSLADKLARSGLPSSSAQKGLDNGADWLRELAAN